MSDASGSADDVRRLYSDLLKRMLTRYAFDDTCDKQARLQGRDWPVEAETMVGPTRLDNVEECVRDVVTSGVPGDLIETGVWRGGTCIFMRAMLKAYGVTDRIVWVADSFQGLPRAEPHPGFRRPGCPV